MYVVVTLAVVKNHSFPECVINLFFARFPRLKKLHFYTATVKSLQEQVQQYRVDAYNQ